MRFHGADLQLTIIYGCKGRLKCERAISGDNVGVAQTRLCQLWRRRSAKLSWSSVLPSLEMQRDQNTPEKVVDLARVTGPNMNGRGFRSAAQINL